MTIDEALNELRLQSMVLKKRVQCNREIEEFVSSAILEQRKNAIDIAIKSLELQISMKKHCDSHDCADCRTNGMCARTFMLDELQ